MISNSPMVQVRKDVPSGSIILNRPARRNALSTEMLLEIRQALEDLHQERRVRAVILTGTENVFSSGADLHEIHDKQQDSTVPPEEWQVQLQEFQALIELMLRYPKPILCAPNGWVVGSAWALLLASDLVVASDKARFVSAEPRRGLVAGLTAPLLCHRLGASRAAGLLLQSQVIDAAQALQIGLVHHVVEDRLVWFRSHELAKEIALLAPESIQLTKKLLNETIGEHVFTQLSIGAANTAAARTTESAREGVRAFLEKRPPKWL